LFRTLHGAEASSAFTVVEAMAKGMIASEDQVGLTGGVTIGDTGLAIGIGH
jgi:hypothetical protein